MRSERIPSYLLVAVQFLCLGLLALTGPVVARNPLWLALEAAGGFLGIWAIVTMQLGNFNITPDVRADSVMVSRGPYRWVRHPMYSALLLVSLALLLDTFTWIRLAIVALLAVNLVIKLSYEERLLIDHHPAYADYARRTKRLIPWIY